VLKKGDQILLYTDGFTETFNPDRSEEFGEARLQASFITHREERAEDLLKNLLKDVEAFGDPRASDDLTALAIRVLT
jgi:serine phosphatase RsbU (regulator of sigma subunit)